MAKTISRVNTLTFREIMANINNGQFAPFYLLMGEEDYYIDKIVERLEQTVVSEDEKDFNAMTFYGSDADVMNVISTAQQFPLMSDRQLVLLKEAQSLYRGKSDLEKLAPYLNHPNNSTVLVVTYKGEPLGNSSALVKSASQVGVVFKSDRVKDYQMAGPVSDYCRENKLRIDDQSIRLLCDYIGGPLSKLFGEIDKLKVASGNDNTITPQLIEDVIGISKEYNAFELVNALSVRDFEKSMRLVTHFAKNPKLNPGVVIVATLFNYFSKLFVASILKDKSDASLMSELDIKNAFFLKEYRNGLKNYKAGTIDAIIHAIRECDAKSKGIGSNQNEFELLKELVYKILTLR